MSFRALGLIEPLLAALAYAAPTSIQKKAIPPLLAGRDLFACAPTGTGKTAAFVLPMLQKLVAQHPPKKPSSPRALLLAPTRELAEQLLHNIQKYAAHLPLDIQVVYGGVPIRAQIRALRSGADILVATPGRLLDLYQQQAVSFTEVCVLVLDEADRMLAQGFATELNAICTQLPSARQTILCSATGTPALWQLQRKLSRDALCIEVSPPNTSAVTVQQELWTVDKKRKPELLLHLLSTQIWQYSQVLVFVNTRRKAATLEHMLQSEGIAASGLHGDQTQPQRQQALLAFRTVQVRVLIATDVAARGLDIPELPLVVNLDLPTAPAEYIHRIGRTARAGASGAVVSLVCADEIHSLLAIEALLGKKIRRMSIPDFAPEHRLPERVRASVKVDTGTVVPPSVAHTQSTAIRALPKLSTPLKKPARTKK